MEKITIEYAATDTGQVLTIEQGFTGWKKAFQLVDMIEKNNAYKVLSIKISFYD